MMPGDMMVEDSVWYDAPYDAPSGSCGCQTPPTSTFAPPTRIVPTPQVVPLKGGVVPAGGAIPPPPATPQTREPELLRR